MAKRPATGAEPGGEFDAGLLLRARRHAALGEPIRLAIVDHLAFGDASPGELADLVGLPSNLTAHHLRVLEHAGLIGRTRSEGDRRRSYVRLRLDDPQLTTLLGRWMPPGPLPTTHASRVVFVCTRNSARSQLAAAAWRQVSGIPVASAGTHPAARVHPGAVRAARRHGLELTSDTPRHLTDTVTPGDLLVAVCDNVHEELVESPPTTGLTSVPGSSPRAWLHWSTPDPVRIDTDTAFDDACEDLTGRVRRLVEAVEADDSTPTPRLPDERG